MADKAMAEYRRLNRRVKRLMEEEEYAAEDVFHQRMDALAELSEAEGKLPKNTRLRMARRDLAELKRDFAADVKLFELSKKLLEEAIAKWSKAVGRPRLPGHALCFLCRGGPCG